MDEFKKGQKVYWRDPAGETSGVYEVYNQYDEYIYLIGNGASETEVYAGELHNLSREVIFRKNIENGSVTALLPEQAFEENPCIVASYCFEDKKWDELDCDFIMEHSYPVYDNEYPKLSGKLKEAGCDALAVISEPPIDRCRLLGIMDRIAQKLITSIYITDFTIHDRKSILESVTGRPFIWQVRNSGTWLYFLDGSDWKKRLQERMESFKSISKENLYYCFDGKEFYPVFEQTVLKMAGE
jgi:hypothetical protein